jgi:hypothetical protein
MNLKMIKINFSKFKKINSIIQKLVREPKHNLVIKIYFLKLFHIYIILLFSIRMFDQLRNRLLEVIQT